MMTIEHSCDTKCMWRSEDKSWESVPFFNHKDSRSELRFIVHSRCLHSLKHLLRYSEINFKVLYYKSHGLTLCSVTLNYMVSIPLSCLFFFSQYIFY